MKPLPALAALALMAACATPAQQCRIDATRDLRQLDTMIAQSRQDLARGYHLIERPNPIQFGVFACFSPEDALFCAGDDAFPRYRREPLNRPAEAAKLASLVAQRAAAEDRARRALAACPQA